MRRDKPQRRRGVLLSDYGLSRVFEEQRRLAAENDRVRLSLEAFSADAGLSTRTLSRLLNRSSPVDFRTVETLFFALHLVPNESDYYYAAAYPGYRSALTELPRRLTPLIGREASLDMLENLLQISRLLTLTGTGGIGKTRLAIELARRQETKSDDRVWFFDLTAIKDVRQSITSVATALGIAIDVSGNFTTIRELLSNESGLLVLDNCESVASTLGPFVLNLLSACSSLRVLATSREPLGVEGERVFRVPPLVIPEAAPKLSASQALQYPAVTLFVERARSSNTGFTIDDAIAPAIAEIVRQLDGLPLGIELAAARAGEMSPTELVAYLQTRLTNLGSEGQDPDPRHRSMRALMDWSFERLTELEQMFYCRASIFSGSFDATALSAVCSDFLSFEGVTDMAVHLARKSLLEIDLHATPTQYVMMTTVREYGREQLQKTSDLNFSHWLHAFYYLDVTIDLMQVLRAQDQGEALQSMTREFADVHEALDWSFATHNEHIGAVIVSELAEYWDACGEYREGEDWIRRALDCEDSLRTRPTQAALYEGLGLLLYRQSRLEEAVQAAAASLTHYEAFGDDLGLCRVRNVLGIIDYDAGNVEDARNRFLANLTQGQLLHPRVRVAALDNLGRIELEVDGNARAALGRFQESLKLAADIGRQTMVANALGNSAGAYAYLGNLFLAIDFSKRSMRVFRDLHNHALYCRQAMKTAIYCMRASGFRNVLSDLEIALEALLADPYRSELCDQLDSMAELLIDEGEIERAIVLLTATDAQRSREGSESTSPALIRHRDTLHRARREMNIDAYRDALTNSVGLSIEAAFRTALTLSVSETGRPPNILS
jgi:predicted ATPase